jgi:hypothetical protein
MAYDHSGKPRLQFGPGGTVTLTFSSGRFKRREEMQYNNNSNNNNNNINNNKNNMSIEVEDKLQEMLKRDKNGQLMLPLRVFLSFYYQYPTIRSEFTINERLNIENELFAEFNSQNKYYKTEYQKIFVDGSDEDDDRGVQRYNINGVFVDRPAYSNWIPPPSNSPEILPNGQQKVHDWRWDKWSQTGVDFRQHPIFFNNPSNKIPNCNNDKYLQRAVIKTESDDPTRNYVI